MRKRNWKQYNKELVQRGSLTFLVDPKLFKKQKATCHNGRPLEFSDSLITMLMMVKIYYRISYRFLEGFTRSILAFGRLKERRIPTYSLICKRAASLKKMLPPFNPSSSKGIILDASGVKVYGEGEWKVKIDGKGRPRKWLKAHIAIDMQTQEIVAETTTESNVADSTMTQTLLDQIKGPTKMTMGDGAYGHAHARNAIHKRGSKALVPPPKNARYKGDNSERDEALCIIEGLGGGKEDRSLWGKLTGYSMRALTESTFSRIKRFFGDRLFSKMAEKQASENRLRCLILNEMRNIGKLPNASSLGYRLGR